MLTLAWLARIIIELLSDDPMRLYWD